MFQRGSRLLAGALGAAAGICLGAAGSRIVQHTQMPEKSVRRPVRTSYSVEDEQFLRALGAALPPPLLGGNRVQTLINGQEIFPAMLEAIQSAQQTLTLETYIYWRGRIGQAFAEVIARRARAGVRCHVLLDALGSADIDNQSLNLMKRAGAQVRRFHRSPLRMSQYNHRTHRKLLVVDGRIGFTGGVGIADEWQGDAQDQQHWRDNHYRIEGPVVAQMQSAFVDNWLRSMHVLLHEEPYFPRLAPVPPRASDAPPGKIAEASELKCQMFQSSPAEGSESMRLMYLLSLAAARKSIRLAMAYFVPDRIAIDALIEARRRGVEVTIILPGPNIDKRIVRHASRACWGQLLRAGIRIYEYHRTMYHVKAMIIDEIWTSIGSANFDNRSFRLNDEANLNIYDRNFARLQIEWFEKDRRAAREVTLDDWRHRGLATASRDRAAGLLSGQL